MSTPFPLEQQAQEQQPATWNPWSGPTKPGFFAGLDESNGDITDSILYRLGQGIVKGATQLDTMADKGASALASYDASLPKQPGLQDNSQADQHFVQQAQQAIAVNRARINALTPDPATTGTAVQLINGLGSTATQLVGGSVLGGPWAGAATLGASEGTQTYDEQTQAGVDSSTALKLAAVSGVTNAASAIIPFGFGARLLTKLGTGAATSVALGAAGRYADHTILEDNGYHAMAEQTKVMDGTQLLTDAVMGTLFGGQAHLHDMIALRNLRDSPGMEDAAMTVNAANVDRGSSPGVPTTPEAANIHQSALDTAISQVLNGDRVDVSKEYAPILYHGSPYDFDAFDMSKIGTGEGNQNYAHGLYFGEQEGVGQSYVNDLAQGKGVLYQVKLPEGHMDKMLDWDNPISEQPHVMQALGVDPNNPSVLPNRLTPDMSGQEVYSALSKGRTNLGVEPTPEGASSFLDEKGIPGVKYKDQGSRGPGTGTGTRNVSLFSARDVEITHKNGEPVAGDKGSFTTSKGSTYRVLQNGSTVRTKSAHPEHPGDVGVKEASARTVYLSPTDASKVSMWNTLQSEGKRVVVSDDGSKVTLVSDNPKTGKKGSDEKITVASTEPRTGLHPLEVWTPDSAGYFRGRHIGNEITDVKNGPTVERPPGFLKRPAPDLKPAAELLRDHLVQGNMLEEEAKLRDLEELLAQKREMSESPKQAAREPMPPQKSGNTVTPEEQQAYVKHADNGFEVKMNPATADEHGNLSSTDASKPVFEVTGKPLVDPIKQALDEKPNMTIPTANGTMKAADALEKVDNEVSTAQKEVPAAVKAAVDCFSRKGG